MSLQTINIKDIRDSSKEFIKLSSNGQEIYITKQKTGYGYKRFFICPECGESRVKLYIYNSNAVYCRSCSPISPYRGITNTTKGGTDEMTYRMYRVAAEYGVELKFPFSYTVLLFQKPKYMKHEKWRTGMIKLQILENMRFQTIFFERRYNAGLIRYVLDNCQDDYVLCDIEKYIIDWKRLANNAKQINQIIQREKTCYTTSEPREKRYFAKSLQRKKGF